MDTAKDIESLSASFNGGSRKNRVRHVCVLVRAMSLRYPHTDCARRTDAHDQFESGLHVIQRCALLRIAPRKNSQLAGRKSHLSWSKVSDIIKYAKQNDSAADEFVVWEHIFSNLREVFLVVKRLYQANDGNDECADVTVVDGCLERTVSISVSLGAPTHMFRHIFSHYIAPTSACLLLTTVRYLSLLGQVH